MSDNETKETQVAEETQNTVATESNNEDRKGRRGQRGEGRRGERRNRREENRGDELLDRWSVHAFSSFLAGSTTQFGYAVLPFAAQTVCLPLFGLLPWKSAEIFASGHKKNRLF